MNRTAIALTASAALLGGAALAQGQDQGPRTMTFQLATPAKRDVKQFDVKPRGDSVGDRFLSAATLRRDGRRVGRALVDCLALDQSYGGQACVITLVTRDGQITAQGAGEHKPLPGTGGDPGTGDTFAVTGGTGSYDGAAGTLRVEHGPEGDRLVAALLR
jgi:hypothetical protein